MTSPASRSAITVKPAANDEFALERARWVDAPRPLLALLAAYVLILLGVVAVTRELHYLVPALGVVVLAWRTLQGGRAAAFFLGVLFAFGAAMGARDTVALLSLDAVEAAISAVYTALLAFAAVYVFVSPEVRALVEPARRG